MALRLTEIPKDTRVKKAICPHCKKTIHAVGFTQNSKCSGITVVCKFCGRVYTINAD